MAQHKEGGNAVQELEDIDIDKVSGLLPCRRRLMYPGKVPDQDTLLKYGADRLKFALAKRFCKGRGKLVY